MGILLPFANAEIARWLNQRPVPGQAAALSTGIFAPPSWLERRACDSLPMNELLFVLKERR